MCVNIKVWLQSNTVYKYYFAVPWGVLTIRVALYIVMSLEDYSYRFRERSKQNSKISA